MTAAEYAAFTQRDGAVPPASKYRSLRTVIDDIVFPSKLQAMAYVVLKDLRDKKAFRYFLRDVPFHLPGNVKYVADFVVVGNNLVIDVLDTKGYVTQLYKLKWKQVRAVYGISVVNVTRADIKKGALYARYLGERA